MNHKDINLEINDYIIIKNKYIGKIYKIIWNGKGYIVKLINNDEYIDEHIKQYGYLGNLPLNGFMLVYSTNDFELVNSNNLIIFIKNILDNKHIDFKINNKIRHKLNGLKGGGGGEGEHEGEGEGEGKDEGESEGKGKDEGESEGKDEGTDEGEHEDEHEGEDENNNLQFPYIPEVKQEEVIDLVDNPYKPGEEKLEEYKIQDMGEDDYETYIRRMINKLFLNKSNPEVLYEEFNTPIIYVENKSNNVLDPDNINDIIKPELVKLLTQYLKMEMYYDFKETLMYRHLILDNSMDMIPLGKQFITNIKNLLFKMQNGIQLNDQFGAASRMIESINLFDFIEFKIVGEYIEMVNLNNNGSQRIITPNLVKELNYLNYMYNKPINYIDLSEIILKNKTAIDIEHTKIILQEALSILSLEYLISLQPKIEYLLWTICRLIICWYADTYLYNNIYKIKILINLYRARGDKEINKDIGVQPLIIILPNYGAYIAQQVLFRLSYFFGPYKKKVGWDGNIPTYFKDLDNLIYYAKGSTDFKKYLKLVKQKTNTSPISIPNADVNTNATNNNYDIIDTEFINTAKNPIEY
jgi:hypothetical protein